MTDTVPDDVLTDLFGFTAPTEQQLSAISVWASKALELQAHIAQVEEQLKGLNKELQIVETVNLPKALLEAGVVDFTTTDGAKIAIRDVIRGGLSKDLDQRSATFEWVINNGGQEIIKDHFEIDYSKGLYHEAVKLRDLLIQNKVHFDEFESIHAQTLHAFLREKMKDGTLPPFDDMGLYFGKHAEVKPARKK